MAGRGERRPVDEVPAGQNRPAENQESVANSVNNQANIVSNRQDNSNGGIPIKMTGGIQAPHGCFGNISNQSQATIKGISNARDILEVSKAAYGTFKQLRTLKDKNNLLHAGLQYVRESLKGGAFKI